MDHTDETSPSPNRVDGPPDRLASLAFALDRAAISIPEQIEALLEAGLRGQPGGVSEAALDLRRTCAVIPALCDALGFHMAVIDAPNLIDLAAHRAR